MGAALGVAGCAPSMPAPVVDTPTAPPSAWSWASAQADPSSSTLAITGGAPPTTATSMPTSEPEATRRLAFQPGVAGQPMVPVGECVNLTRGEDGHTTFATVPCGEPHQAQVVGYVDVLDGPRAPAPPLRRLQGIAAHHCPILGGEFLGQSIAQRRDLTVNWTGPARREWSGGARTLVCLVSGAPNADGTGTQAVVGDLRSPAPTPTERSATPPVLVEPAPATAPS